MKPLLLSRQVKVRKTLSGRKKTVLVSINDEALDDDDFKDKACTPLITTSDSKTAEEILPEDDCTKDLMDN